MISYQHIDTGLPDLQQKRLSRWVQQVAAEYEKKVGDLAFIFCSDEKILEVNLQYLEHDYYTDIITFDYSTGNKISGDLFISVDTVATNALQFGTLCDDELHRVMIHGVLHLCGQGDKSDDDRKVMTEKENKALSLLTQIS